MDTMTAYHFCEVDAGGNVVRRDGQVLPPGALEVYAGPVCLCKSGLHAARHPADALRYALGPLLRQVACRDIRQEQRDKFVCVERRELGRVDATRLLREFACDCVGWVMQRERAQAGKPAADSVEAVEVARRYARGAATAAELQAANAAALRAVLRIGRGRPGWLGAVLAANVTMHGARRAAKLIAGALHDECDDLVKVKYCMAAVAEPWVRGRFAHQVAALFPAAR